MASEDPPFEYRDSIRGFLRIVRTILTLVIVPVLTVYTAELG